MLPQAIVATRKAYITGVSLEYAQTLFVRNGPPNPVYRHNAECVASAVILWPGVVASFARLVLLLPSPSYISYSSQIAPISCGNRIYTTLNSAPKQQPTEIKAKKPPSTSQTRTVNPNKRAILLHWQHIPLSQQTLQLILELEQVFLALGRAEIGMVARFNVNLFLEIPLYNMDSFVTILASFHTSLCVP